MPALTAKDYMEALVAAGRETEAREFAQQIRAAHGRQIKTYMQGLIDGGEEDRAREFADHYRRQRQGGVPARQAAANAFNQSRPTTVRGVVNTALEGATLGWSDELFVATGKAYRKLRKAWQDTKDSATVRTAIDAINPALPQILDRLPEYSREQFESDQEQMRQSRETFAQRSPRAAAATEIAGGLSTALVPARTVLGAGSLAGAVGRGAAAGALEGAAAGAGFADPGERGRGAVVGGLTGAALGGAAGAALPVARATLRRLRVRGPSVAEQQRGVAAIERRLANVAGRAVGMRPPDIYIAQAADELASLFPNQPRLRARMMEELDHWAQHGPWQVVTPEVEAEGFLSRLWRQARLGGVRALTKGTSRFTPQIEEALGLLPKKPLPPGALVYRQRKFPVEEINPWFGSVD